MAEDLRHTEEAEDIKIMAKEKTKTQYRLYAHSVDDDSISYAQNVRFGRITRDYVLVYVPAKLSGWPEITDENINILAANDRKWLFNCNMTLISEEMAKKSSDFGVDMSNAIEELEKALKAEKEKLTNEQQTESDQGTE